MTEQERIDLQRKMGPYGICEVISLRANTATGLAVAGITSQNPTGGGHFLMTETDDDTSTTLVIAIGKEPGSQSTEGPSRALIEAIIAKTKIGEGKEPGDLYVLVDNCNRQTAGEITEKTGRPTIFLDQAELNFQRLPTGETKVTSLDPDRKFLIVTPDELDYFKEFEAEITLVRAHRMNEKNTNTPGFANDQERDASRQLLGGADKFEFYAPDPEDEECVELKNSCCGSDISSEGGHLDITEIGTQGNAPTIVLADGYNPEYVAGLHPAQQAAVQQAQMNTLAATIDKVSHASNPGANQPIILACSYMTNEWALELSRRTQRPVVFASQDVVINHQEPNGDVKLLTESNRGFYIIDARENPAQARNFAPSIGVPVTRERRLAQQMQQGFTAPANESQRAVGGAAESKSSEVAQAQGLGSGVAEAKQSSGAGQSPGLGGGAADSKPSQPKRRRL